MNIIHPYPHFLDICNMEFDRILILYQLHINNDKMRLLYENKKM